MIVSIALRAALFVAGPIVVEYQAFATSTIELVLTNFFLLYLFLTYTTPPMLFNCVMCYLIFLQTY